MNVRDGVPFEYLTEEERAVIRMWIAIGLNVEVTAYTPPSHLWITFGPFMESEPHWGGWRFRLKP